MCCRVWKDPVTLDPDAVINAHQIIKAGVEMFPNSAYMVLLHGNFMIDVLGVSQSGSRRIEDARKLNPSLMCRFIMFVRQQQATQTAAGSSVHSSSRMDLLGYVEYQRKQRMVVRLHREALQAMCNFWKALDSSNVSFKLLSKTLGKIESSVSQAQRAYQVVLEGYGNNPKLVYLYGKFLQTVKNDPWHAAKYISEAERLEALHDGHSSGPLMPDGTPLSRMDDLATAVLVMNSHGEVQMANKHAQVLFGYKRGDLEGKPLAALLAPHFTQLLSKRLAALAAVHESEAAADTEGDPAAAAAAALGGGDPPLDGELVVGLHCERLAFPAKLILHKAQGVGEDSTIVAVLEPVPPETGVASLWVTQNGFITACDGSFVAHFGWRASEVNGANIQALMTVPALSLGAGGGGGGGGGNGSEMKAAAKVAAAGGGGNATASSLMRRLLTPLRSTGSVSSDGTGASGRGGGGGDCQPGHPPPAAAGLACLVPHKYMRAPVACELTLVRTGPPTGGNGGGGINSSRGSAAAPPTPPVHEIRLRLTNAEPPQLVAVNRKGHILHASSDLAACLLHGHDPEPAMRCRSGRHGDFSCGVSSGGGGPMPSLALLPPGATADAMAGYTLLDFLAPAWRGLHTKVMRDIAPASPPAAAGQQQWTCRKSAGSPSPTLELRTASGKELYMRVRVTTTEVQGEMVHVVRMERSSLEAALAERRLCLRMSPDGLIDGVEAGNPAQLFGMDAKKLVGRGLWEVLEEMPLLEETRPGTAGPHVVANLISRSLMCPGQSWRVRVGLPPPRGGAGGLSADTPLLQIQRHKLAVMRVRFKRPIADAGDAFLGEGCSVGGTAASGGLFVELWPTANVMGVLDLDPYGRVRAVLEERTRPAGLMFGVPSQSLVGSMLGELVALPPGRGRPWELLTTSALRKSSLKTRSRESNVKVGPVHVLRATHLDGQPLSLDVQIVGKPGHNEPATAILRFHVAPFLPRLLPPAPPPQQRPSQARRRSAAFNGPHSDGGGGFGLGAPAGSARAATAVSAMASAPVHPPPLQPQMEPSMDDTSPQPLLFQADCPSPSQLGCIQQPPPTIGTLSTPPNAAAGACQTVGLRAAPATAQQKAAIQQALSGRVSNSQTGGAGMVAGQPSPQQPQPLAAGRSKLAGLVQSLRDGKGAAPVAAAAAGSGGGPTPPSQVPTPQRSIESESDRLPLPAVLSYTGISVMRMPGLQAGGAAAEQLLALPGAVAALAVCPSSSKAEALRGRDLARDDAPAAGVGSGSGARVDDMLQEKSVCSFGENRISKWVATKGAFFQNTDPDTANLGAGLTTSECGIQQPSAGDEDRVMFGDSAGNGGSRSGGCGVNCSLAPAAAVGANVAHGMLPQYDPGGGGGGGAGGEPVLVTAVINGWAPGAAAVAPRPQAPSPPSRGLSTGSSSSSSFVGEGLMAAAGDEGTDNAGSDGEQSAASGSQSASGSEYTRGKRLRKLTKMMDSGETQQAQRRLRVHSLATVTVLAALHILCFTLTVLAVRSQREAMQGLSRSGEVQLYTHMVMIDLRSLDIIANGKWLPTLYTPDDAESLVGRVAYHAESIKLRLNELLSMQHSTSSTILDILYKVKRPVWESNDVNGSDVYTNLTIWDLGTRFYAMAKNVQQNHDEWVRQGAKIAETAPGQFILKSGPDLFGETRKIMDALLYETVASTRHVEKQQVIFLVVEGAVISFVAACYLAYLLRAVATQRYKLYSIFLVIPPSLTRALAAQSTNIFLDEDDDDDDDEEDEYKAAAATAAMQQQQELQPFPGGEGDLLLQGPGRGSDCATAATPAAAKLRRRATLKLDPDDMAAADSGDGGGPAFTATTWDASGRPPLLVSRQLQGGSGRAGGPAGGAAAATATTLADLNARNSSVGDDRGYRNGARSIRHQRFAAPSGGGGAYGDQSGAKSGGGCWRWLTGWLHRYRRSFAHRLSRGSILPMPQQSFMITAGSSSLPSFSEHGGRRRLMLDSHATMVMLMPFIVWSTLVIAMYTVAVITLHGIDHLVGIHSVVNFMAARTSRTIFYAQELANVDDSLELPAMRLALAAAMKLVRDVWFTLELGADAYMSAGNDTEKFPLVSAGLSRSSPELLNLFYIGGECHRKGEHLPCPGPEYRYYQMSYTGLDSIAQQFFMSLKAMAANTSKVPPGLHDVNFDYIYNVGYKDLLDGTVHISEHHSDAIRSIFDGILLLHVILFLLFWVIFSGFLVLQLNPLLKRIAEERRRIAELMSQLPLELDVERLVARALGTAGSALGLGGGGVATGPSFTAGGGGGSVHEHSIRGDSAVHDRVEMDAVSKWKAIIRANTSLNGKAPSSSTDGRKRP